MFQSIKDMYNKLIFLYGYEHERLKDMNIDLLTKLIDFFNPIYRGVNLNEG